MATHRTTVMLPLELKSTVADLARELGVSFGEFVRRALEKEVASQTSSAPNRHDPLLDDDAVFRGRVPKDFSQEHDLYLYGE